MIKVELHDQVICMRDAFGKETWRAVVNGKLVRANWPDKGSAIAGMKTEQHRLKKAKE